jgi:hypothetical protein
LCFDAFDQLLDPSRRQSFGLSPEKMPADFAKGSQHFDFVRAVDSGSKTLDLLGDSSEGALVRSSPLDDEIRHLARSNFLLYIRDQVRIEESADPLLWWKTVGSAKYQYVEPIARKYFSALASSAQIERTFSNAKFWCRDERGRISDDMLELLTILHSIISQPDFDLATIFEDNPFREVVQSAEGSK